MTRPALNGCGATAIVRWTAARPLPEVRRRNARSNAMPRRSSASRGPARRAGYHLHPTAGTIFHKSSTSLHLWFYAMYLMTSTRCGISAKQLERELGVTYKTAWRMAQPDSSRLMTQDAEPFTGGQPIEMDETYVGGRRRRGYVVVARAGGCVAQDSRCSVWCSALAAWLAMTVET